MGSEIELFQIVLLLVTVLMCCGVIYSSSLKITYLNTWVHWGSDLSPPCPVSGLWCRGTGAFLLQPQARLKIQQWSTGSWMAVVRDAATVARGWPLKIWEHVLAGTVSCRHTVSSSPLLCTSSDYSFSVSHIWKSLLEWKKVFKKECWTLWRITPAQFPLGILP